MVHDVLEGYLTVGSALGRSNPRHLAIALFTADGEVNAVIELGFLHPVDARIEQLLRQISVSAGVALRTAKYRTGLQNLSEQTQRQSEELQVQADRLYLSRGSSMPPAFDQAKEDAQANEVERRRARRRP